MECIYSHTKVQKMLVVLLPRTESRFLIRNKNEAGVKLKFCFHFNLLVSLNNIAYLNIVKVGNAQSAFLP